MHTTRNFLVALGSISWVTAHGGGSAPLSSATASLNAIASSNIITSTGSSRFSNTTIYLNATASSNPIAASGSAPSSSVTAFSNITVHLKAIASSNPIVASGSAPLSSATASSNTTAPFAYERPSGPTPSPSRGFINALLASASEPNPSSPATPPFIPSTATPTTLGLTPTWTSPPSPPSNNYFPIPAPDSINKATSSSPSTSPHENKSTTASTQHSASVARLLNLLARIARLFKHKSQNRGGVQHRRHARAGGVVSLWWERALERSVAWRRREAEG